MSVWISNLLGAAIGFLLMGCSVAGYYLGTEIDGDPKLLYDEASGVLAVALAQFQPGQDLRISLRDRHSIDATFQSSTTMGDSIAVIEGKELKVIPGREITRVEERTFRTATKVGVLVGAGIDVAVAVWIISNLGKEKGPAVIE